MNVWAVKAPHNLEEPIMQAITTIGLDIAKSVFQVHGIDAQGQGVTRRQLKRRYVLAFFQKLPQCLVGIEACASSHHWWRELKALGHTVRLMPPAYVKPYVKRQKNDAADAEAICEAVSTRCATPSYPRRSSRIFGASKRRAYGHVHTPRCTSDINRKAGRGPELARAAAPPTFALAGCLYANQPRRAALNADAERCYIPKSIRPLSGPVSYTHLTLPTNRAV